MSYLEEIEKIYQRSICSGPYNYTHEDVCNDRDRLIEIARDLQKKLEDAERYLKAKEIVDMPELQHYVNGLEKDRNGILAMQTARIKELEKAGLEMLNLLEVDSLKHNIWRKLFNKE